MSVIYTNGSVTHTFGNVACVAMDYVKRFFPQDFFNVEHISTKLAYRQLDIFKSKQEFWKLHKPILILRPRIEMDDNSKYFYGATFMNRMTNVTSPAEYANRIQLVKDPEKGVSIEFLWNRYKIYYDVVIIVDTYNEQLNLAHHLLNSIVANTPFMIHTPLESYVPRSIINKLADYLNIDQSATANIIQYLNTYSRTPFTYKFKDGSGNNEYFTLYDTNIETIVSELSLDDGNQKGMITDAYSLSFTFSCEFNSMAAFYLTMRDNKDMFIPYMPDNIKDDNRVKPLFTIPLLFNMTLDPGWVISTAPTYFISTTKEPDITDLSSVLSDELKGALAYQKAMNLPQDLFVKFRVFKNTMELPNNETGYEINLDDLEKPYIITYDLAIQETYRLFVLVNNNYINSIKTEIIKFNHET